MEYDLRSGSTRYRKCARESMISSNVSNRKRTKQDPAVSQVQSTQEGESSMVNEEEDVEDLEEVEVPLEAPIQAEQLDNTIAISDAATVVDRPTNHPPCFGNDVPGRILEEVIDSFIVKRGRDPPRIPLCRLMENEAIRAVGPGTEGLVEKFEKKGYSFLGPSFIISFKKPGHDQQFVTDNDLDEWGPVWREVNEEFERDLPPEWEDLRGKKFFVWDGNHRLKTWLRMIKNQFSMIKWRHCLVKCEFVNVDRSTEGELMLALKSQNEIGRTTVCTNFGQEIFLFQKLAMASKESLMKDFPKEWLHWIEVELACERKAAKGTWYNAPAILLAMLVWKEEFDAFLAKEMVDIKDASLTPKERESLARSRTERVYKERAYKMLSIANPSNGQGFFSLLFNYSWIKEKDTVGLTKDKIHALATVKITIDRKRDILHSIITCSLEDVISERYISAQKFRIYLRKEWYWGNILKQCIKIKGKMLNELLDGFDTWFANQRRDHIDHAFCELWARMNTKDSDEKIPELVESSKRVFYRWIIKIHDEHSLEEMPDFVHEWTDLSRDCSMYPSWIKERGLNDWEVHFCPWWLDYPVGEYSRHEALHYKEHAFKRPLGEMEEVGSASKQTSKSKKKTGPIETTSGTMDVSIQKRLEFMSNKPSKKANKKFSSKKNEEAEPSQKKDYSLALNCRTIIASALLDVKTLSYEEEARLVLFLRRVNAKELSLHGEKSVDVVPLLFADFPTGCLVENISMDLVPAWNDFTTRLSKKVASLAGNYVADRGWYITLCSSDHFGAVCGHATNAGFKLSQTIHMIVPQGYIRKVTHERVEVLLLGLFYRKGNRPIYDRKNGEIVNKKAFDAHSGTLVDPEDGELIGGGTLRGVAERTIDFYRWLVLTFTCEDSAIIDVFAGCGGLGIVCAELHRHCLCIDNDAQVYEHHLRHFEDHVPSSTPTKPTTVPNKSQETDWDLYEPGSQPP